MDKIVNQSLTRRTKLTGAARDNSLSLIAQLQSGGGYATSGRMNEIGVFC